MGGERAAYKRQAGRGCVMQMMWRVRRAYFMICRRAGLCVWQGQGGRTRTDGHWRQLRAVRREPHHVSMQCEHAMCPVYCYCLDN